MSSPCLGRHNLRPLVYGVMIVVLNNVIEMSGVNMVDAVKRLPDLFSVNQESWRWKLHSWHCRLSPNDSFKDSSKIAFCYDIILPIQSAKEVTVFPEDKKNK